MELKLITIIGSLFTFGALLMALAHEVRKFENINRITDWTKYSVYLFLIVSLLLSAYWSCWFTAAILGIVVVAACIEFYFCLRNKSCREVLTFRGHDDLVKNVAFVPNNQAMARCVGNRLVGMSQIRL